MASKGLTQSELTPMIVGIQIDATFLRCHYANPILPLQLIRLPRNCHTLRLPQTLLLPQTQPRTRQNPRHRLQTIRHHHHQHPPPARLRRNLRMDRLPLRPQRRPSPAISTWRSHESLGQILAKRVRQTTAQTSALRWRKTDPCDRTSLGIG